MKKLMTLCLSVLMVLSMCSFTVMAEETTAAVSFEDISNGQLQNFILSDLAIPEGATVTSSNEVVISTTGKVTRPIYEDAVVTLTVNGTSFDVTVKAKTIAVKAYNDFTTTANNETTIMDFDSNWSLHSHHPYGSMTASDGKIDAVIARYDQKGYSSFVHNFNQSAHEKATWLFDISDITSAKEGNVASEGADVRLTIDRYNAEGTRVDTLSDKNIYRIYGTYVGGYTYGYNIGGSSFTSGEFGFTVDSDTGDLWIYFGENGAKKATVNLLTELDSQGTLPEGLEYVRVRQVTLISASTGYGAKFSLDNYRSYSELTDEEALASATPAELKANYSYLLSEEYVANGGNLSALTTDLKFTADEDLPEGVSLSWVSSDEAVISNNGTVTPVIGNVKTVTVTGTLSVEGTESLVKTYTVTVPDPTISYKSEVADAESLTENESFVGADGWTPESLKTWESMTVLKEDDGNKYFRIGTTGYQPKGSTPNYTFRNAPTSIEDGETLVLEFRVKVPALGGVSNMYLTLNGNEMGKFIYSNSNNKGWLYNNEYSVDANAYQSGIQADEYYGPELNRQNDQSVTADTWYDLRMEVTNDSWVKFYIEDTLVGTHKTTNTVPASITSAALCIKNRGNADTTDATTATCINYYYDIDDIKLYKKACINDYLSLVGDDAAKVNFVKSYIEDNGITVSGYNAGIYKDLHLVNTTEETGVTVTWKSSNTAIVADDGTITLVNSLAPADVVMTATIAAGDVKETISIPVQVAQEGTELIGAAYPVIDFDTYTPGFTKPASDRLGTDDGHGGILQLKMDSGTTDYVYQHVYKTGMLSNRILISADAKYSHTSQDSIGGKIIIRTRNSADGLGVMLDYKNQTVNVLTSGTFATTTGEGIAHTTKWIKYPMSESLIAKEGEWLNVVFDYNALSLTYDVYIDGEKINNAPILDANAATYESSGYAITQIWCILSGAGEFCVDNITVRKYSDTAAAEVNAALNAAHYLYGSEAFHSALTTQELKAKTIDSTFVTTTTSPRKAYYNLDSSDIVNNPAGYTFATADTAPVITYKIDGADVTKIGEITSPKTSTLTITATSADGTITESRTMERMFVPSISIRDIGLDSDDCINSIWIDGTPKGTEKVILAQYNGKDLVSAKVMPLSEENKNYLSDINLISQVSVSNPKILDGVTAIKIFVVDADGITPLTYADTSIHD